MAETTASASTSVTKEGVQIKGKDVILLNAPEVLLSPDTPLLTTAQDIAGAINELFMLDPGGGDGSFKSDPDWETWKQLPEPGQYQAIYGVRIVDLSYTKGYKYYTEYEINPDNGDYVPVEDSVVPCHIFFNGLSYTGEDGENYCAPYTIDWGDGSISTHPGGTVNEVDESILGLYGHGVGINSLAHRYSETGLYIITATFSEHRWGYGPDVYSDDNSNADFKSINQPRTIFAKFGSGISIERGKLSYILGCPRFIKFLQLPSNQPYEDGSSVMMTQLDYCLQFYDAKKSLPTLPNSIFNSNYALTEDGIDVEAATSVGNNAFRACYSLHKLYLPNCTSIGSYAFYNCYSLKSIEAPKCTSIGASAFYNCYALHTLKVADGCTFGSNAFSNCYSLYPHPDGTL